MKKMLSVLLIGSLIYAEELKNFEVVVDKSELTILNPALQERKSLKVRLPNGLEAYLISDPGVDQSAAALSVEVGSWQDPAAYPGMAHFLEHMLFMGTKAYPDEAEYMQYIKDCGGQVNASTFPDRTIYMFSVNNDGFKGALDRFSHFFIDPLFNTSSVERELHAVDQEHSKNIEHDGWRSWMILKSTANPEHPISGFSTGNAQTLGGIPSSELKRWYERYYSAHRMHLFVISHLPLNEMADLIALEFSQVPKNDDPLPALPKEMLSLQQKGKLFYIKPVRDLRTLSLVWEVPEEFAVDNEKKVPLLLSYVLCNKSENSLLEHLKKQNLVEEIATDMDRLGPSQALFQIDVKLTKQGVAQVDQVISEIFQTLALVKEKSIPRYVFDEIKKTTELAFQYQSREDAFEFAFEQAKALIEEELDTFPHKSATVSSYDPALITQFAALLTPHDCYFSIQADPKLTGVNPDLKEKWMAAEYAIKDLPQEKLAAWNAGAAHAGVDLPRPNPFVPSHVELLTVAATEPEKTVVPQMIDNENGAEIYYAQDTRYMVPESAFLFNIKSPLLSGTDASCAAADLYLKALKEKLAGTLFFAATSHYSVGFAMKELKFQLSIQGFNEKAPLVAKEVFSSLGAVHPTKEQFETLKQSLLSAYENVSKELPVFQAVELMKHLVFSDAPLSAEKAKALKALTYEEFTTFCKQLFKSAHVEGTLYGNLTLGEAKTFWASAKALLAYSPYQALEHHKRQVLSLPKQGPFMVVRPTDRQGNGVLLLLEHGAFTFEKFAAQQILSKALGDGFFDTLRTKQQTAYFARSWDDEEERQLFQYFAVQSSTHSPHELLARFELFLEDFDRNLSSILPEERFENLKHMGLKTLEMPPENLPKMADRLHELAFNYKADFHWIEKCTSHLEKLDYPTMRKTARELISRSNPKRLAVLVEGVLPYETRFQYNQVSSEDIRSLGSYVSYR